MPNQVAPAVGLSICTACGETYRYRGHLHCPLGAPVAVQPKPEVPVKAEETA